MCWTSVRTISATPDRVFRAVADPEEFQRAIPGGAGVEYLTASRSGVGITWSTVALQAAQLRKLADESRA
jgi:carbon monoxide dehydrogenase subunit G